MPRLRCFLLATALLGSLASAAPTPCKDGEVACFVNGKCINPANDDELDKTKLDVQCDARIEIRQGFRRLDGLDGLDGPHCRPYSTKKAYIRLKSKKGLIKLSYQDPADATKTTEIFGCENKGKEGIVRTGEDADKGLIHQEKSGTGIVCEFLYESSTTELFDSSKIPELETGNGKVPGAANMFGPQQTAIKLATKCDIDWLTFKTDWMEDEKFIYSEPTKYFSKVVCPSGDLVVQGENDEMHKADSIECKKNGADWEYQISGASDSPAKKDATRAVGCRSSVCTRCATTIPDCGGATDCKKATVEPKDDCKILKCKEDTFPFIKINNETIDASTRYAECTKREASPYFGWTFDKKEVTSAECLETVHCQELNPIVLDESAKDLSLKDVKLSCGKDVLIRIAGNDDPVTEIVCDPQQGKWKAKDANKKPVEVPRGSEISCQVIESTTAAPAGASIKLEYIAAGIGGLIIIACTVAQGYVIGIIVYCFVCKKKLDKKKSNMKIKTITSKRAQPPTDDPGLKTALPVGYLPPNSNTNSDQPKVEQPELLPEKTTQTPESKPKSVMMKTAVLNVVADEPSIQQKNTEEIYGPPAHVVDGPDMKKKDKSAHSDGSEPRSIKIGKNGELLERPRRKSKEPHKSDPEKSGEKSNKSEVGTTKKEEKEEKKATSKAVDDGPKPQVFSLNAKEEKIRKGATKKQTDYPTFADVHSDWDDYEKAYDKGPEAVEKWKKKQEDKHDAKSRNKTVPTAVTPDQPGTVERTQGTRTRNTMDKGEDGNMENLLTQMDNTLDQKEADEKKK